MCTALSFVDTNLYFGRNMDLEYDFGANVVIIPRNFELKFKGINNIKTHYAIIGMSAIALDYPLLCDGANEKGLCVAGLNFNGFSVCNDFSNEKENLAPYEIISYILAKCKDVLEAKNLIKNINLCDMPFIENLPVPTLHWIISDKEKSIVFEFTKEGGKIFDNPVGVMTNNPTFDYHLYNLSFYKNLGIDMPNNSFKEFKNMGVGEGSLGLPGDFSSASRFVRATFLKLNSPIEKSDKFSPVSQTFHILNNVAMPRGSVMANGNYDITMYSACIDTSDFVYYFKSYDNQNIRAVKMHSYDLDSKDFVSFPLESGKDTISLN